MVKRTPTAADTAVYGLGWKMRLVFNRRVKLYLAGRWLKIRRRRYYAAASGVPTAAEDLGAAAKVHFTNVGKYERGEAVPAADILNRIAKALDVSTDYLLNGTLTDKSADAITDEELLGQFRKVEGLPANKKKLVKEFLDAFIFKNDLQKQLTQ